MCVHDWWRKLLNWAAGWVMSWGCIFWSQSVRWIVCWVYWTCCAPETSSPPVRPSFEKWASVPSAIETWTKLPSFWWSLNRSRLGNVKIFAYFFPKNAVIRDRIGSAYDYEDKFSNRHVKIPRLYHVIVLPYLRCCPNICSFFLPTEQK